MVSQSASPKQEKRGLAAKVDDFQRRHPVVSMPIAVVYKYLDDGGSSLAALITYFGFVSLFPLLLLASTVLGLVLVGYPDLQERIVDSAVSQLPVVGQELGRPEQIGGGLTGLLIGTLGALYGGMGVAQAVQNASQTAWAVPRNQRPNPVSARVRSVILLVVIGVDVIATSILASLVGRASFLGPVASVAAVAGALLIHSATFAYVFRLSSGRDLSWAQVRPGAVMAAVLWLGLQYVGVAYVGRSVESSSATNGVFAVVLGLLAFLYLVSIAVVMSIELNVVLANHLHPRALLTPFTDNVELTQADERSYENIAKAQQLKGFSPSRSTSTSPTTTRERASQDLTQMRPTTRVDLISSGRRACAWTAPDARCSPPVVGPTARMLSLRDWHATTAGARPSTGRGRRFLPDASCAVSAPDAPADRRGRCRRSVDRQAPPVGAASATRG